MSPSRSYKKPFWDSKNYKFLTQKYYVPTCYHRIDIYIKSCNIFLAFKTVYYKLYNDFQLLPVFSYELKDLSIDFVTSLPNSTNWKRDNYDLILFITDQLIKIVYYKSIKIIIKISKRVKVIIDMIIQHYSFFNFIINNRRFFLP